MLLTPRLPGRRLLGLTTAGCLALILTACGGDEEAPAGSPFSQALYKDYTDLATQAAAAPAPENNSSFFDDPFGLVSMFSGSSNPNDLLVTAFNDKASLAQQGQEPAPEAAPADQTAQNMRARLVRALAGGKNTAPDQAARAQVDYDCWVLDGNVTGMAQAAQACRTSLDGSLLALENAARSAPPPAPVAFAPTAQPPAQAPVYQAPINQPPVAQAPVAQAPLPQTALAEPPAAASAPASAPGYTVYFDFDSWTLTAEDLTVITQAINAARAGGQSHITVVGHTDTAGPADYNQKLSVRRANVVVEALVDMGARRAAIQASGVGETDLAVQTPDNTKEPRNRRSVISLIP
jgi:outer membrane protein OmpA-like peptidoglycan-associated protein